MANTPVIGAPVVWMGDGRAFNHGNTYGGQLIPATILRISDTVYTADIVITPGGIDTQTILSVPYVPAGHQPYNNSYYLVFP